jgi:hypothetical protein
MPISIYNYENKEQTAWLCKDDWELPSQVDNLEKWLESTGFSLPKGDYVADIGFNVRENALGGGAILSIELMKKCLSIGMAIYLSEYPED